MKKLVFLAIMLLAATGFGAMLEAETMELGLSGALDFDNPEGHVGSDIDLGLGYFFWDDIEAGGLVSFGNEGSDLGLGLGVFAEVIFDIDYPVAPFVAASLQYKFGDYFPDSHVLVEGSAGLKFFLTDYLSINGGLVYSLASEDVYVNNGKAENHDAGLRLGLSCYF